MWSWFSEMETRSPCMCSPAPLLQTGKPCLRVDHSMMGLFHSANPAGFCSALSPQATISSTQSDRVVSLMGQDKAFLSGMLVKQNYLQLPRSSFPFVVFCYSYLSLKVFILLFFVYGYFVCMYVWVPCCMPGAHRVQKRGSDPLEQELQSYEPPCECWEMNPGLLEEQS